MVKPLYQGAWLEAGKYQILIKARYWEAGMYLIRLASAEEVVTKQLILQW